MFKKLTNIGDNGILCDFGNEVNREINTKVIKLFQFIKSKANNGELEGVLNCTPSYNKLIISFDLHIVRAKKILDFLKSINISQLDLPYKRKEWSIPICYDLELDLKNMSKELKISQEKIIEIHQKTNFFIYMVGFIPGHPFMGDLDSQLFTNRLKTPRVKLPAGSVGVVEKFCNIYTHESPGGWNIIGRTPIKLFNNHDEKKPCLLSPGDTVKFRSITKNEFNNLKK